MQIDVQRGRIRIGTHTNARGDSPDVHGAVQRVEGGIHALQLQPPAQVHRGRVVGTDVVHAFGGDQPLEELNGRSRQPRNIHGNLFQRQQRSLAASITKRVGHFGAPAAYRASNFIDRVVADQVADIGDNPRGTRFDELVVVKLLDVLFQNGALRRRAR